VRPGALRFRIATLAIAATAAAILTTCSKPPPRPNVLLVTIDTLRADRVGAAGSRVTMPNLDAFAREALRFTHAETPRAKTTPAVVSLMTGLYPHAHGSRELLMPCDPKLPLLAERLRAAGWKTAAIVGNYVLTDRLAGLARGFESWTEDLPQTQGVPPDNVPERTAHSLTNGALTALGLLQHEANEAGPAQAFVEDGKPWFLWLHYMDPHGLYSPPAEQRVFHGAKPDLIPALAGPQDAKTTAHPRWIAEYNVPPEARDAAGRIDAACVRDLYDGEAHYVDAELGRLFAALRAHGLLENTIVVVTADHGESLGEQDYWFEHGRNVSEATCRVPLVVRYPESMPSRPAPAVRDGDVSLVDLAPTLLDVLALPPLSTSADTTLRGESRRALFERNDTTLNPMFVEKVERDEKSGAVQMKAVRIGDWKLARRYTFVFQPGQESAKRLVVLGEELYDLAHDPREEKNLAGATPNDVPKDAPIDRLRAELLRFSAADVHFADLGRLLAEKREQLKRTDRDTARILESLGY
jgi:arylsulfatase A-like enzyme